MPKTNNRELIIGLIKNDLINTKLISGLENLGIDAGLYLLGISDAIFVLMGVEDDKKGEELFEYYLKLRSSKLKSFKITKSCEKLDCIVSEIYNALIKRNRS